MRGELTKELVHIAFYTAKESLARTNFTLHEEVGPPASVGKTVFEGTPTHPPHPTPPFFPPPPSTTHHLRSVQRHCPCGLVVARLAGCVVCGVKAEGKGGGPWHARCTSKSSHSHNSSNPRTRTHPTQHHRSKYTHTRMYVHGRAFALAAAGLGLCLLVTPAAQAQALLGAEQHRG